LTNRRPIVNCDFIGVAAVAAYHRSLALMSVPTCVIAGAGPGLSLAVAERYAREGFVVYALSCTAARLSSAASRLQSRGLDVSVIDCDLGNVDSVETAIHAVEMRGRSCEVLVYNTFDDGRHAELANVSPLIRKRAAAMRARQGGALVFAAHDVSEAQTETLRQFVNTLADEIEPAGIRVGIVVIDGALPTSAAGLASIAEVYWDVFFGADDRHRRERHIRASRPLRA
jgi:short chain dehydrogenase